MKKANTYIKFLETVHPLSAEVYHDTIHDIKVYKTTHSFEDRNHLTKGHPLGVPENRSRYFQKCTTWVSNLPNPAIQEYLFYDMNFDQGMVMAYRPDSLRGGKWCLSISTILPFKEHQIHSKHPIKKGMLEKLLRTSQMPSLALQYLLNVAFTEDKVITFWQSTKAGDWDAVSIRGNFGVGISMDKGVLLHVTMDKTHSSLRLVEV